MRTSTRLLIEHLRGLAEQGKTLAEAAEASGLVYNYVCKLAGAHDISFARQYMSDRPGNKERAADMRCRYEAGETLDAIGKRYNLTRERVRQILSKRFGTTAKDGGKAETGRQKRRELHRKRNERSLKVHGCSYRDYRKLLKQPGKPSYAYWQQRRNAIERGIGWEFNLWQWWKVWDQSGHWSERGRGRGYHMCRLNDAGPYSVDNVYIATGVENMQDYWVKRRASKLQEAAA